MYSGEAALATVHNVSFRYWVNLGFMNVFHVFISLGLVNFPPHRWSYPGLRRPSHRGRLFVTTYRLLFVTQSTVAEKGIRDDGGQELGLKSLSIPFLEVYRIVKRSIEYGQVQITIQTLDFKYVKLAMDSVSSDLVHKIVSLFTSVQV